MEGLLGGRVDEGKPVGDCQWLSLISIAGVRVLNV